MTSRTTVDLTKSTSDRHRDRDRRHAQPAASSSSSAHRSHSSKPHHSSSSSSSHHRSSSHKHSSSSSSHQQSLPPTPSDPSSLVKKTSQFQFDPVYTNTLPTPPAAPKRLHLPSSLHRLTAYCGGSLLASYRQPLYTDALLGLPVNFVNTAAYIAPASAAPLSPSSATAFLSSSSSLSSQPRPSFLLPSREQLFKQGYSNWARKPEYTSNNLFQQGNSQLALVDVRKKEVEEVSRRREERRARGKGRARDEQLERIERTFQQAGHIPSHPRKKHVHAVSILPVLPDAGIDRVYAWTEFDYDPQTGDATHVPTPRHDNALLYPLPPAADSAAAATDAAAAPAPTQHALYVSAAPTPTAGVDEVVWTHGRDYELVPTPAVDTDNNFFFLMTDDAVLYSRYSRRMRVSKRIKRGAREEAEVMESRAKEVRVRWTDDIRTDRATGRSEKGEEHQQDHAEQEGEEGEPAEEGPHTAAEGAAESDRGGAAEAAAVAT